MLQFRVHVPLMLLIACAAGHAATTETAKPPALSFGGVHPRISPDGQFVAMSYQGAICRFPVEGGRLVRLTRGSGWDVNPAWSPDGRRIAYVNAPNFSSGTLRMIHAEDGATLQLPANIRARGGMFFHPDGKRLLGRFSASGYPQRLAWTDLETGRVAPVDGASPADSNLLGRKRMHYALSPDGSSILYSLSQDLPGEQGGNNGPQTGLWRIDSGGGTPEKVCRFPARIHNLFWNAEGNGCFLVSDLGGSHYDVWSVPLRNPLGGMRKITHGLADEDWPSASRDGHWLIATDNARGATAIVRHNLHTGARNEVPVSVIDFREPVTEVQIKPIDAQSGRPVTARISILRQNGKFFAPLGALYRFTKGRGHFYSDGDSTLALPHGEYTVIAWRGPEYRVFEKQLSVNPGAAQTLAIELERWIDMAAQGWYSGENHIHANYGYGSWYNNPVTILRQCQGEDLNVCNAVVANSDGDGVFDREFFRGGVDPISTGDTLLYWNEELRSTIWGHLTLQNLSRLVEPIFTGFEGTTNPYDVPTNADVEQETIDQGAVVSYTHPASNPEDLYDRPYTAKGLPVDAALGRVHTMDVMCGGYDASRMFWYKLLNCGFRIHAAAGTDCFLNRISSVPPGWGRAYVHLPSGLTYRGWIEGQKAGQSFVSNGPMLEFTVNGRGMGQTIQLEKPGSVKIIARGTSQFPLDNGEIVVNGQPVASAQQTASNRKMVFTGEVEIERSGWIAFHVSGPPHPHVIRQRPQAHTNPIYIEVKNHPIEAAEDARHLLDWIERLEADLNRRNRLHTRARHVQMQIDQARSVYRSLLGN